ncbi:DUF72 domain-containing protein [Taibaiella koreensis]|uniref:DUF72 domain-containing protein n=1 Tax=Taibaiella koreensis TaxID=1268548 RepID=UPI0013C34A95|nr:DUF72 domain-containing protein [Taibaiella koreensis]
MEFGKVTEQELEHMDCSLPPDPEMNQAILAKGKGKTRFYIGCAKWGRKDWVGTIYRPDVGEQDMLRHYARIFNTIEFSGFYYNLHSREQVLQWKKAVPPGFLFCPKLTQYITHVRRLRNVQAQLSEFLDLVSVFGKNLGPLFLMPHPQLLPQDRETLETFIDAIPPAIDLFLELRHEAWYTSGSYDQKLLQFLKQKKRGTVITDAAARREALHMQLSKPECYIRFIGNALHATDYHRIDHWVTRIKQWMNAGLEKCYFFVHQKDERHAPRLIQYLTEQLNNVCGAGLPLLSLQTQVAHS